MLASFKMNAFFTGILVTGSIASPGFAAAVVAGAFGMGLAAAVIYAVQADTNNPIGKLVFKGRSLIGL